MLGAHKSFLVLWARCEMKDRCQVYSSEATTAGHPDKLCDQIADAILDAHLRGDRNARVACEVLAAKELVVIAGEFSSDITVPMESIARQVLLNIGYDSEALGMNGSTCEIRLSTGPQSNSIRRSQQPLHAPEHPQSSRQLEKLACGDQSIVIGYAA